MSIPLATADDFTSIFISAPDGLSLNARCIGPRNAVGPPVVCLPGLTRTAQDFDILAHALATNPERPRRVIAIDYRGRGLSDYDRNPLNYSVPMEVGDVLAVLTKLEAAPAVFVGTSRGGILAMVLATVRPDMIKGVVLNDIGPVIEPLGLMRIKGYIGKTEAPAGFSDAAAGLQRLFGSQFPNLTAADWLDWAKRAFKDEDGKLIPTYDLAIANTFDAVTAERQPPPLWAQFDALAGVPMMVIRGGLSDLLSKETVAAMRLRHHGLDVLEVADQGHAPLLADAPTIARIAAFVSRIH